MTSNKKAKVLHVREEKENNLNDETPQEKINKLENQVTTLIERNVDLQSWLEKYINTIKSMETLIKQLEHDLEQEKAKKHSSDSSCPNSSR